MAAGRDRYPDAMVGVPKGREAEFQVRRAHRYPFFEQTMGIPAAATDPKASIQPAGQQPPPEASSGQKNGVGFAAHCPVVGLFGRRLRRPELGPPFSGCFGDAFPTGSTSSDRKSVV